jgi:2-oxo-4-hydroxy-4-carboxy-5-ureidoimidazoline decarboxylase
MAEAARLPSPRPLPSIPELNGLPDTEFGAVMAPLFEGAPSFLGGLAAARPFASYEVLWARALEIARAMPEPEQLELINAHPRLGAPPASVSALSFREQGYDPGAPAEAPAAEDADEAQAADAARVAAELERLNAAYEARFGFRFCIFVNGRSRTQLLPIMFVALSADRPAEIQRALADIVAIAADRAARLAV